MTVYGYAACTDADTLKEAGAIPFSSMLELKDILSA
jgi:hypothetical protein